MRLNTFLQQCSLGARRQCDTLIFSGKVCVNKKICRQPGHVINPSKDLVTCEGQLLKWVDQKHIYLMLNKPLGYLCSTKGSRAVLSLVESQNQRLFTIGRLDKQTSGLLLITSNGQFCQAVTHPSKKISKEYIAKVDRWINADHLKKMSEPCMVEGSMIQADKVVKVRKNTVKIVIHDGKKHEVRQITESAGLNTIELKRVRIGGLQMGALPIGASRPLTPYDIAAILGCEVHQHTFY